MAAPSQIIHFSPVEETPLSYISTPQELQLLATELAQVELFGFDLEYHSQRSYDGFTCLMQISTREKDYVIDTIALREKMDLLRDVFEDKRIVKVKK
jgi:exosome complex exonuclease RRP6